MASVPGRSSPGEALVTESVSLLMALETGEARLPSRRNSARVRQAALSLVEEREALRRLPDPQVLVASRDVTGLREALRDEGVPSGAVVELAERYVKSAEDVRTLAANLSASTPEDRVTLQHEARLKALAGAYGRDAARERSAASERRWGGVLMLAGSVAAAIWAAQVAATPPTDTLVRVLGPLVVVVALGIGGILLLRAAGAHDRAAREYTRLERGVGGIDSYLAPLPPAARHLMRATMTQVLFPRLPEDDDPLREPEWPDARTLMYAVNEVPPPRSQPPPDTAPQSTQAEDSSGDGEVPESAGPAA